MHTCAGCRHDDQELREPCLTCYVPETRERRNWTPADPKPDPDSFRADRFLLEAVDTMRQRGKDYDQPDGERSMGRVVDAFNVLTGLELTEADGWLFMVMLKLGRLQQARGRLHADSIIDGAAYLALMGECLGEGR